MSDPAIVVDNVSKTFRIYHDRNRSLKATVLAGRRAKYEEFWALRDIDLEIPQGKTFGLLGNNGSGKSTLLKCIAQILVPNKGTITHKGRLAAMLEVGSGFHPELSGRENVYLNGAILGMSKVEIDKKFDEIVDFSGVEEFIDQPVKNYSSGMYVRLGFAVSIHVDPDILLVDEVLAVGDMAFQEKCAAKFVDLRQAGRTVVVVSHAMEQMRNFCDEAVWLQKGRIAGLGKANEVITEYADQAHAIQQAPSKAKAAAPAKRAENEGTAEPAPPAPEPPKDNWTITDTFDIGGRHGTGEATITGVAILNERGEDVRELRTGDMVRLHMEYVCHSPVAQPVYGFTFQHESGFLVWGHNNEYPEWSAPTVQPGEGSIDMVIPQLLLRPGVYRLGVGFSKERAVQVVDHLPRAIPFVVKTGTPIETVGVAIMNSRFDNLVSRPSGQTAQP